MQYHITYTHTSSMYSTDTHKHTHTHMHHIHTYTNIQTHPYIHAPHTHTKTYPSYTQNTCSWASRIHTCMYPHTQSNKSSFIRSRMGIVLDSRRLPVPDTEATDRAHQQLACLWWDTGHTHKLIFMNKKRLFLCPWKERKWGEDGFFFGSDV